MSAADDVSAQSAPARGDRSFTIDDILKLEDIGRAVFDPTGHFVVYDRMPHYEDSPDYGVEIRSLSFSNGHMMIYEMGGGSKPRPVFKPASHTGYIVASFSPAGDRLAFIQVHEGHVRVGVYEFASRKIRIMPDAPDFADVSTITLPLWLDNKTLAYSAMPPGEEPAYISQRHQVAAKLASAWTRSWRGASPSFRRVSSGMSSGMPQFRGHLVSVDVATSVSKVLAAGRYSGLRLSPSRGHLAALKQYPLAQQAGVGDWLASRSELWDFDLRTGKSVNVGPQKSVFNLSLQWSADSTRLSYFSWANSDHPPTGQYEVYNVRNQTVDHLPYRGLSLVSRRERGWSQQPERAVWLGDRIAVAARELSDPDASPGFGYGLMHGAAAPLGWWLIRSDGSRTNITQGLSDVFPAIISNWKDCLYLLAAGDVWRVGVDGSRVNMTQGKFGKLRWPLSKEDDYFLEPNLSTRHVVLTRQDQDSVHYIEIDLESGVSRELAAIPARSSLWYQLISVDPIGGSALLREPQAAGSSIVLHNIDGPSITIDRLNAHLAGLVGPDEKTLEYKSSIDGRALTSCMQLPTGYVPGHRYPMIVSVYPATESARCKGTSGGLSLEAGVNGMVIPGQLFSGRGYIYLVAAAPASLERDASGPQTNITETILDAVDAAVAKGYADPKRVGLVGSSNGGFTTLWMATQTDRFAAIASLYGFADPWRHTFDSYVDQYFDDERPFVGNFLRYETPDAPVGLDKSVWDDPDAYIRNSPIAHADHIHTPLLMINSDMDGFNMGEYDAMFTALNHLNRRADYITYWGEGHGVSSPANIRHSWDEILKWFDIYVKRGN